MNGAARRNVAATFVLLVGSLLVANVAAQSVDIPSSWIDITNRAPALDDLVAASRSAAMTDVFWVGYSFPLREGVHVGCDERRERSVSFDSQSARLYFDGDADDHEAVVCDDSFGLFLRVNGSTSEIVEATLLPLQRASQRIDAPVVWVGEYGAEESVAFLRSGILEDGDESTRPITSASRSARARLLAAVAVHDGDAAVDVVLSALNPQYSEDLRESAVFWTSQVGGVEGLARLLEVARTDDASEVRKLAIFWLGQVAGERATAHLAAIAEDDPDTEVRTSAVFALSQSDDDAAVEALVRIVRTHDNREVVKAALFWLGQSGDPRAVALLEKLLFGVRN